MASGGAPSFIDLMLFHTMERNLFARLTRRLGLDHGAMSSVMALWLWLESIGHHDFIRHVYSYEDDVVLRFVAEAEACLAALANPSTIKDGNCEVPNMSWQMNEPIDLRFFDFSREVAVAGIGRIKQNVCRIIFDDELMKKTAGDMSHPASRSIMSSGLIGRPFGEESSGSGVQGVAETPQPESPVLWHSAALPLVRSALNPMARPWTPPVTAGHSPEDQRSMFITFSKGHPISKEDILEFFTMRYGPSVETVMIEKAPTGQPPMYGRVVFTSAATIAVVLNGQRTAKFMIKGRHLWARMYVPRQG